MLARSHHGHAPRGFSGEEFSENLVRPYVRPDKKSARRHGRGMGRGRRGAGLCPGSEIEIRFSVDRYNPVPVPFRKRSEWASRSRHSQRDGDENGKRKLRTAGREGGMGGEGGREEEEMDRSIVPDVERIMRLQITSRLRASAAKLTNQRSIVARSNSFVPPLNGSRDSCTFGKRPSAAI